MDLLYTLFATLTISSMSFIGVFLLIKKIRRSSILITALIAFAAGTLLGDVFFHLIPEHIESKGYDLKTVFGILAGILIMLVIESILHCSHDKPKKSEKPMHLAYMNISGDAVHNFLDGVAVGAAFLINPTVGFATTIAVILHEIPQEFADASVLLYAGWKKTKILMVNFLTALTAVMGALFVFILKDIIQNLESFLIPVAAGQFIYIALADLLPEIHKKTGAKKYIVEITAFILGTITMYLLTLLE